MAQIFSPPKKIEATMPSGRKTYRYAGDSDTLKKKIAGLKKSGASGVSVVAEGVSSELGEEISSVADRKARIAKGIYPKNEKGQPNTKHLMFHQYKKGPDGKMGLHKHDGLIKLAQDHAASKNEETNLYELSPETVKSFMQKRLKKSVDHNKMAVDAADKGDKEGYKKHSGLQRKNFDGAMKAIRHAGNTLKRRTGMNEIAQQSIITHNIKSKDSNRPVVKKGTQLEGAFKRKLIDKMEKERLGGGTKSNVSTKKPSKAWSDIGYSNEKPKEKKKIHQSFQKGGKNDPGGMGALLHAESVKDYIEVKGGNMSKQEISKLVKNRKKEMKEGKKPGLWDNIHAKRARIKAGSGERMRKPGSKGAPTAQDFKDASESNVAFKNFLEARQIDERKGATAGFLMRQLYLKRLMKRLNLPVSVAAMIDK